MLEMALKRYRFNKEEEVENEQTMIENAQSKPSLPPPSNPTTTVTPRRRRKQNMTFAPSIVDNIDVEDFESQLF